MLAPDGLQAAPLPALAYLLLMMAFGDVIARRFLAIGERPQRLATAFLVGLLLSTWLTYVAAYAWMSLEQPLVPANAVALAGMAVVVIAALSPWRRGRLAARRELARGVADASMARPEPLVAPPVKERSASPFRMARSEGWDWLTIAAFAVLTALMCWGLYRFEDGKLWVSGMLWSDFGPTTAISQGFALGHNFPTEYPHFAGLPILYHFMFWFQVGNLTLLGLDPASALNLLSTASIASMLTLVMALGRGIFASAAVGRIGAVLFFFHGTLNLVPYLGSFATVADAVKAIPELNNFLPSIFPYRGDSWGIWAQIVFLNQRHLASAIGILLVVLVFLLSRLAGSPTGASDAVAGPGRPAAADPGEQPPGGSRGSARQRLGRWIRVSRLSGFVACGGLLGLLPLWNGPVFIAAGAMLATMLVLFGNRIQMLALGITATAVALPQLLALRPASLAESIFAPVFHWGYVVEDPTVQNVVAYVAWSFGLKLALAAVAIVLGTGLQRRLFIAASSVAAVAFLVQLSPEVLANHKFLNLWTILLNLYAAYGAVRLCGLARRGIAGSAVRWGGRLATASILVTIVAGGLIDLIPLTHTSMIGRTMEGDRLFDWVVRDTKRTDVFLTAAYVSHPVLLAGRRIFYGYQYFTWGAGYPVGAREAIYNRMLTERDPTVLLSLLRRNNIAQVAIDDGLRKEFGPALNEDVLRSKLATVFTDPEGNYDHLAVYHVDPGPPGSTPPVAGADMFTGGVGSRPGLFREARGIGVDSAGNVLVADTGNDRIQRFAPDGAFLSAFGTPGQAPGQLDQPNGVAVDGRGRIFVTEAANHRIQEFDEKGNSFREWRPNPAFYGPRDIAVAADGTLFILDQGHGRVVTLRTDGSSSAFGSLGEGDGQLRDPTGLALGKDRVYVADAANGRIVEFDTAGRVVRSQVVAEWPKSSFEYPDLVVGPSGDVLYASSPATNEILTFDLDLRRIGKVALTVGERLQGPSAMALRPSGGIYVYQYGGSRVAVIAPSQ
jgi:DNA-binding beta-propeller fold protein YncE